MSYESEVLSDWYLLFHYGNPEEILHGVALSPDSFPPGALHFPEATVHAFHRRTGNGRVLDAGCAVGRSTFELTRYADEAIGIDFSQRFIDLASTLGRGETVTYRRYSEAHRSEDLVAHCPAHVFPEQTSFEQGDAMDLRADLGTFDLVHAANLLCRLPEPKRFLDRLPGLVNPGGELVIATPATWLDAYTPRENQPTGTTLEFLKEHLADSFDLIEVEELPFLIREHQRKLQLSTSQTSLWRRK